MSTTHDLNSLPRWARSEITNLRSRVEDLEAQRAAGPDDTDTYVDHVTLIHDGPENRFQRLRRGADIIWWDQPGWPTTELGRVSATWRDRLPGTGAPGVEIRTSGAGQMIVTPQTSNVIYVYEIDR